MVKPANTVLKDNVMSFSLKLTHLSNSYEEGNYIEVVVPY